MAPADGIRGKREGVTGRTRPAKGFATRERHRIALTAHAFDDAREQARSSGCDGFVTKPCLPDDLVARVRATLETGRKNKR